MTPTPPVEPCHAGLVLHPNTRALERPDEVPLVLLHGFPLDHRMWDALIGYLDDVPVLAADAPGFGCSPRGEDLAPGADPALETYAHALVSALDERCEHDQHAGKKAVVAGLSMGGYVVQALAELVPDRLLGIGLLDTNPDSDSEQIRQVRLDAARRALTHPEVNVVAGAWEGVLGTTTKQSRPQLVAQVRDWLEQARPDSVAWAQRAMASRPARRDVLEAWGRRERPSLVLRGSEDLTCTHDIAECMAQLLHTDVVTISHAGHMSGLERPEAVAQHLRALWERSMCSTR